MYHYTDKESAKLILKSKVLRKSQSPRSTFGRGVFLTILQPSKSNHTLLENNYNDRSKFKSKIQCAFAFDLNELVGVKKIDDPFYKNRDIWRNDNCIDLNDFNFKLILRE